MVKLTLFLIFLALVGASADEALSHRDKTGAAANSIQLHGDPPAIKVIQ